MAKLKVSGSASGTGTITLIAPATDTDRTITLPDESITLAGGVDGIVSTADATAITIDSSENVGIGVTPGTWETNVTPALQLGDQGAIYNRTGLGLAISSNHRYESSGVSKYLTTDPATVLETYSGGFLFYTAPSGTAGTAITFTNVLDIKQDGRGVSQFTAKAWVNFNGTVAAASMIRDSHNVSSITDNGTGNYTVNFSNAMANTSYSVHGTVGGDSGNGALHAFEVHVNGYSTSSSKVLSAYVANSSANRTQYDESYMNVLYFGD